jgi:hypothetical protein
MTHTPSELWMVGWLTSLGIQSGPFFLALGMHSYFKNAFKSNTISKTIFDILANLNHIIFQFLSD